MSILKLDDIKFSIGDMSILNGISFEINPGETVGIIGPNGSGKTTMFNCISGFNIPQSGSISFRDQDITKMRPYKRAQLGLGRVFQNFGIFREMTAQENIIAALESKEKLSKIFFPWSETSKKIKKTALEYLAEVELEGKAKLKASSLSGGQMRLLEIVRSLSFGAELFLLDEPTAGVSPKMKKDVASLIKRLQDMKKTVLVIEHDINFIQSFCDRIIVLDVGRVVMDGTPQEVRGDERLQEIYFGKEDGS